MLKAPFLRGPSILPFLTLPFVAALLGGGRRSLSHTVTLAEELVFALFLISTLSLDLSCFPEMNGS